MASEDEKQLYFLPIKRRSLIVEARSPARFILDCPVLWAYFLSAHSVLPFQVDLVEWAGVVEEFRRVIVKTAMLVNKQCPFVLSF